MEYTEFWTILSANNIVIDVKQIEQFKRYEKELLYWNEKINLISRQDEQNIVEKHFLHSLSILKYIEFPKKARCLDIGTGGGFPGLPLKIALPEIYMLLIDSIKKKLKTTEMFAKHTGLRNIECKLGRVEDLSIEKNNLNINNFSNKINDNSEKINDFSDNINNNYKQHFDIILSRAVAQTVKLIDWSLPLLKSTGKFIFLKGGDLENEINDAKNKYSQLNFTTQEIVMLGCDWMRDEGKKIITVSRKND
jgi:16S rRNA (guanine527-N7)-methyltransferase